MTLKKHLHTLVQELISSLPSKWVEKLTPYLPIKKLKQNSKNSKRQRSNTERMCSKCGEEKPLDLNNFQKVKTFKEGFSFYCNDCAKPKPRD